MRKKILLGCFEIPGFGGASTSTYKLFEMMHKDGFDVTMVNLISESDTEYFKHLFVKCLGNPKGLPEVYNCFLKDNNYKPQPDLTSLINDIAPDIMLGVGWIAALLMKKAAPERDLIFLTTGNDQLKMHLTRKRVKDYLSLSKKIKRSKRKYDISSALEKEAVDLADYVITHSEANLFLFQHFFYHYDGKISHDVIWFADWICDEASEYSYFKKPFHEREIDLIFIASTWERPEKNYPWIKKIVSRFKQLNIHIVGEVEKKITDAIHHGIITERKEVFKLLGNSKTIVCFSKFDAAPGILFEASVMGCNIIASKNCGNWMICNENLLVDPCNIRNFQKKIPFSLAKKFESNLNYFLKTDMF